MDSFSPVQGTGIICYELPLVIVLSIFPVLDAQQEWGGRFKRQDTWSPWKPPWDNFDPIVQIQLENFGAPWIEGLTVEWHIDDKLWEDGYPGNEPPISEYPPWFMRRINCFLGVPYARPPINELRFRRPDPPRFAINSRWNAKYFRPACPQDLDDIRKDIPDFPAQNVSEDCLYMNIFVPNITKAQNNMIIPDTDLYPVVVYIHGGRFLHGTAQQYPGHVLATSQVVVVTFNYRLGALGFLSTEDEYAQGNWGLFDQYQALKFVRENIRLFRGDPNKITVMGDGAGAASIGLHLVSNMYRGRKLFDQTIMMSGTDLSSFAFLEPYWRPREYAWELAEIMGCPTHHTYDMMLCLRNNQTKTWQWFRDAQRQVKPKDGALGIVWGPVQDGTAVFSRDTSFIFLQEAPFDLRRQHAFQKLPSIIGLDTDAGADKANQTVRGLEGGMFEETMKTFVLELLQKWKIIDIYRERAFDAVNFQYTYWPDPENRTARSQEFINMVTDLEYGMGMDSVIKTQSQYEPTYVYEFKYKSWHDWVPKFMGTCCSAAVPYILGFPFLNETVLNETELIPRQWFDYDDRNMSEWMMYMWTNFIKYGEPTPNITRNITWEPYNPVNLSYVVLDWHSHVWFRYRQDFYGFWKDYFPGLVQQDYLYPTATPTPAGYEYVIATGSMTTLVFLLVCGIGILAFLLWHQREEEEIEKAYRESDMPLGMPTTPHASMSSLSRKSAGAPEGSRSAPSQGLSDLRKVMQSRVPKDSYDDGGGYEQSGRGAVGFDRSYDPMEYELYESKPRRDRRHDRSYEGRAPERSYEGRGPDRSYDGRGVDRSYDSRAHERSYDSRRHDRSYDEGRGRYDRGHTSRAYINHPDNGTRVQGATQHHTVV